MKYIYIYIYRYIYKYISKSESTQDLFQTSSIRKCKKNRKSKILNSSIVLFQKQFLGKSEEYTALDLAKSGDFDCVFPYAQKIAVIDFLSDATNN
jgi:hypothetical protein